MNAKFTLLRAMATPDQPAPPNEPTSSTSGLPSCGLVPPPAGAWQQPPGGSPSYDTGLPQGNKKALWSMILGITSLICFGIILGPIAIILSVQAKNEIAASGGRQSGSGQARAGMILGIIGAALTVLYLAIVLGS